MKSVISPRARGRRLAALLVSVVLAAATAAGAALAQPRPLIFGVSEGTSGGASFLDVLVKYQPLADEIGRVLGRKVNVLLVREFERLEAGMRERDFDIVMARPSDYPARGLRDYGWRFVATARPDGQCLLIVKKDSPLQSIADAKGKRFILPESSAYMTRFCRAELRDRGIAIEKESVQYTREQSTVAFALQAGQADIGGIASYSGAAGQLDKNNQRVLHRSIAQPYFPLIVSNRLSAADVKAIQDMLVALDKSEATSKAVLAPIGIRGFDVGTEPRLRALLGWLEK
ncbi:phosphate/phosphite/phosphonate ABC transporter substrate-binding protein [Betaproteobacteria bacterium PRO7]|jgi:ABC-type phosphate/phosphonate transport system substrate-binding protein|nr:phosphate/phosphite/phosphonate ABC transporter substrate-binding protein [Burkholderiaceae bacterium]MDL1861198.1 phosphate/phosphite/phosphonate ABC transporter substrate-binding protein [Betaproteobacteria bacterium PRO7]GIL05667.1 MAG: hypothetical protein BroJett031_21870 [Betaproteobacteria bacterium]